MGCNQHVNVKALVVGTQIDIQRSDGRIHAASISGVDDDSITVEWFENGETKGKEINFEQLLSINPQFRQAPPPADPPKRLTSVKTRQSHMPTPKPTTPTETDVRPSRNGRPDGRSKSLAPTPRHAAQSQVPRAAPQIAAPASVAKRKPVARKPPDDADVDDTVVYPKKADVSINQGGAAAKSNCVKEVERLKKNREERRQRQNEQKKEDAKVKEIDPGNPNWQFLKMIRDYQDGLNIEHMSMNDPIVDHQISVCVRKRPLNKKETNKREIDVITIPNKDTTTVHECKLKVDLTKYLENHKFRFDYSFDEESTNELVYRYTAKPLVETIFKEGVATCFAYGQTGSGKTHTMGGDFSGKQQDCAKGIYSLAATDVFKLQKTKYRSQDLIVAASFFEIYSGKVFDLMNKRKKLQVLEDGKAQVQIVNLSEVVVNSATDVLKMIEHGMKTRTSGTTSANSNSSRSHAVFQIILRKRSHGKDGTLGPLHGKFSLIDLAGNERGADTISADRQTRLEGAEINKSLLALKECIRALGRKGAHLPFRASKLTQVLKDSFMGDRAKTCMIAMVSPGMSSTENTLNTLRYADRVKELGPDDAPKKNLPVADLDYSEDASGNNSSLYLSQNNDKYRNQDLADLLHTEEAGDVDDQLYNYHDAISVMQETEDNMIDMHRENCKENQRILEEELALLDSYDNDADTNIEEYIHRLDMILEEKVEKANMLREKIKLFREQLNEEEKASRNVKRVPFI